MSGRYALIKGIIVENVIISDEAHNANIQNQWDTIVLSDVANRGDSYVDGIFTAPAPQAGDPLIQKNADIAFGQNLMAEFSVMNDQRGLTDDQRLQLVQALGDMQSLLQVGDLKTVLNLLPSISIDGVLLTSEIIASFQGRISLYLTNSGR